jgi:phosphatidylglycerophosphate synthase
MTCCAVSPNYKSKLCFVVFCTVRVMVISLIRCQMRLEHVGKKIKSRQFGVELELEHFSWFRIHLRFRLTAFVVNSHVSSRRKYC